MAAAVAAAVRAQDAGQRGPVHGRSASEPAQQIERAVDVSTQSAQDALVRLGLKIIAEPEN